MSQERNIVTSDGELVQDFLSHIVEEGQIAEIAREVVDSRKEVERQMLEVMSKLERDNVPGLPRIYSTLGRGRDRIVICNTPYIEMDLKPKYRGDIRTDYLVFSRLGISALRFLVGDSLLDERYIERYRDPLASKIDDPGGGMFDVTFFHNLLRSTHLSCVKHEFITDDGRGEQAVSVSFDKKELHRKGELRRLGLYYALPPNSVRISTQEAQIMFGSIEQFVKDGYRANLTEKQNQLALANDISASETEKPKRGIFKR